jgi:hypothetical protein
MLPRCAGHHKKSRFVNLAYAIDINWILHMPNSNGGPKAAVAIGFFA